MNWEQSVDVVATPAVVWAVLSDVATWPEWTTSMTSVQPVQPVPPEDPGGFGVGSRVRVVQPKLRPAVWTVTDFRPPQDRLAGWFTWVATAPGIETSGTHVVTPAESGGCRVVLGITQSGVLAGLVGRLLGRRTRDYLATEAAGLKARSEAT